MIVKRLIFGINDFAEIVYENISHDTSEERKKIDGFVVDDEYYRAENFCGLPVYRYSKLKVFFTPSDTGIIVCIGYSGMNEFRKKIFERLSCDGWYISSFIDDRAIVNSKEIGEGSIIMDGANIGTKCVIGKGNIFYPNSLLAHHSVVGDYNFFAISSSVAGHVTIKNQCFFGNNSCTKNGISVADRTLIGAGTYISCNIEKKGTTIVPMRSQEIQYDNSRFNL